MIYTTLSRIRAHHQCSPGWQKLLVALEKSKADDEPLAYSTILETNGLNDTLWYLRAEPQHEALWRMYAVRCARRVQHLVTDSRSLAALDVAERHAYGQATDEELDAARNAARNAAWSAEGAAAWATAFATTWAAAGDAAWAAARNAAWAAAGDAASAAASATASAAASATASAAASYAARAAAEAEQTADFLSLLAAYEAAPGCVGEAVL